jgi:hypothetical protein
MLIYHDATHMPPHYRLMQDLGLNEGSLDKWQHIIEKMVEENGMTIPVLRKGKQAPTCPSKEIIAQWMLQQVSPEGRPLAFFKISFKDLLREFPTADNARLLSRLKDLSLLPRERVVQVYTEGTKYQKHLQWVAGIREAEKKKLDEIEIPEFTASQSAIHYMPEGHLGFKAKHFS